MKRTLTYRESKHKEAATKDADRSRYGVRCCLCGAVVHKSGWCDACDRWPISATPVRWDERGHKVGPDGACVECMEFVITRLEPSGREWKDTGQIGTRWSRQESKAKMQELGKILESGILRAHGQPTVRDLEAEKEALTTMDQQRKLEQVPF